MSITRMALAGVLLFWLLGVASPARSAPAANPTGINPELLGMVIRDPWYEFGTHPRYPGQPNYESQERMGQVLAEAGVRWVRVEFIIDERVGDVAANLARYDYFINEVAPRYNLKVLGLLGFALVINVDPRHPQYGLVVKGGDDPVYGGGVNPYMKTWLDRALLVAQRYENRVAAYEILNEQNRLPVSPGQFAGGEGIDPALNGRLHAKFYRCFKQNQCSSKSPEGSWRAGVSILIGGLHPRGSTKLLPSGAGATSDRAYLAAIYTTEPFVSYFASYKEYPVDGLGYHPYPVEIVASLESIDTEIARITSRLNDLRARLRDTLRQTDPDAATRLRCRSGSPRSATTPATPARRVRGRRSLCGPSTARWTPATMWPRPSGSNTRTSRRSADPTRSSGGLCGSPSRSTRAAPAVPATTRAASRPSAEVLSSPTANWPASPCIARPCRSLGVD
ncbi:MAG: hypothetical protein OHK0015_30610 [Chloroflexi bacterium OHK40]